MTPAGRYGAARVLSIGALWLGLVLLVAAGAVLRFALWLIRTVGPDALMLADLTADRIAETDLLMDPAPGRATKTPAVIDGQVIAVHNEVRVS